MIVFIKIGLRYLLSDVWDVFFKLDGLKKLVILFCCRDIVKFLLRKY